MSDLRPSKPVIEPVLTMASPALQVFEYLPGDHSGIGTVDVAGVQDGGSLAGND